MARMKKEERIRRMENAKLLYLNGITDVEELADRVNVSTKTIYTWINKENWSKLKKNFILTREEQMAQMLDELVAINESIRSQPEGQRFADAKLAQVRRQLVKDIKDLETKALLPEVISALTQFLRFVRKKDLETAKELSHWVDSFIKSLLK